MVRRCFFHSIFFETISLLLLIESSFSFNVGDDDSSRRADCVNDNFPDVGNFICYRVTIAPNGVCSSEVIEEGTIMENERLIKIASPNFYTGGQYQARTYCRYHVPACVDRNFLYLQWVGGQFDLEPPCEFPGFQFCLDLVSIPGNTINTEQLIVDDLDGSFCGMQPSSRTQITSRPMRITFRSNNEGQFRGFLLNFFCGDPDSSLQRPRGAAGAIGPPPRMCRELGGFSPPPVPTQPIEIPQNGSKVQLPAGVFLTYSDKVLKVVQDDKVLRTFFNIRRLFFWTGLNRTLVFVGSAILPQGEIYGGGRLIIVDDCAYYATYLISPRFNPNSMESDVITFILDALNPFFADQDIVDDGEDFSPLPPVSPKPTRSVVPSSTSAPVASQTSKPPQKGSPPEHRGKREVEELPHNISRRSLVHETTTPPPPALDPRVDVNALTLAVRFQNACNVFLRSVSRSYIDILESEGLLESAMPTVAPTVATPGPPTKKPTVKPPKPPGIPGP